MPWAVTTGYQFLIPLKDTIRIPIRGLNLFLCYQKGIIINKNNFSNIIIFFKHRCRLGVAILNGKMYACGGYDGSTFLHTVEVFDPVTNK